MKPGAEHRTTNSLFIGNTKGKEQLRQEKIINAIIDNDSSDWYSTTTSTYEKRRNYSTFDGRTQLPEPFMDMNRGKNMRYY